MHSNLVLDLIHAAKSRMNKSNDPIHDHNHAMRVAKYAEHLCNESNITEDRKNALLIAAWWHDVARTITERPSFIWMPFIDDLLSALMLWWHSFWKGKLNKTTALAVCLIACKSIGTGAFFTRTIIRKCDRLLVDLLEDSDTLDVLNIERMDKVLKITESKAIYRIGYKISCKWYLIMNHLKVRTNAAKKYIVELLRQFINWLKNPRIYFWHVANFGAEWAKKNLRLIERLVDF